MNLSYRKASKMDGTDSMARFDPERLGLPSLSVDSYTVFIDDNGINSSSTVIAVRTIHIIIELVTSRGPHFKSNDFGRSNQEIGSPLLFKRSIPPPPPD